MDINTVIVRQAIDGLEEGYRVISSLLNSVFAKRNLAIEIPCDDLQTNDSLDHAREMMRRALPKLPSPDVPSDLSPVSPWTFGFVNDRDHCPENVTLSDDSYDDFISKLCAFLSGDSCDDRDMQYWSESIANPVQSHHNRWKTYLEGFLPSQPKAEYSGGPELLRRDRLIYELACQKWTNEDIAKEIESKSDSNHWNGIGAKYVPDRLKEYCLFMKLDRPNRNGRPKKTSR